MHKIIVTWPETSFPTSAEALSVTRMSLVDSAKALGVNEPNVEQFEARSGEVREDGHERPLVIPPEGFDDGFDQTVDVSRWAKAFMQRVEAGVVVDEGFMLGWFANAMAAGERGSRPRHHDETLDGVIVATPDQHDALPVPLDHGFHVVSEPGRHFSTHFFLDEQDREHLVVQEGSLSVRHEHEEPQNVPPLCGLKTHPQGCRCSVNLEAEATP